MNIGKEKFLFSIVYLTLNPLYWLGEKSTLKLNIRELLSLKRCMKMGGKLFNKGLAFVVIFLFVGVSVSVCDFDKTTMTLIESEGGSDTTVSACNCNKNEQVIIDGETSTYGGLTSEDIAALQKQAESEGWTYTVSENPATKYSIDELCGLVEPEDWWVDAEFDNTMPTGTYPDSFDWRVVAGGLPPIKNQGSCGSCWAFGTVAPLECNIKIKDGIIEDLSEQWLVSCNVDGYSCSGGWWCHEYFKMDGNRQDPCGDDGAVLEEYFPYVAYNAPCNCPYPHDYYIDDWAYVGNPYGVATVEQIKNAIYQYGPVSVAVCVNSAFQAYSGGVFSGPSCGSINHAVALVGWDDNQGSNGVWFLRNSWGTGWGEGGYMRIEYGVSSVGYRTVRVDYGGYQNYPPFVPSNPDPEDGEIAVNIYYTDLSWIGGDPNYDDIVTYDVYFEADDPSPDVLVSDDQLETTYYPGTLEYETHYYWKIIATDDQGASTTGPIWDFTTCLPPNHPPHTPGNPSPPDGTIDCDINIDFSWTGGDPDPEDTVFYDVYLDANNPIPTTIVSDDQTETTFDPGALSKGITYYWKIHAKDNHNRVTRGPVWHFTTEEPPNEPPNPPTIAGPKNGKTGETYDYNFVSTDPEGNFISYFVDWDDGTTSETEFVFSETIVTLPHTWNVEETYTIQAKAKDINGDESDWASFEVTITKKGKTMNSPFLNFLKNYLNMFPLLQTLLQRLGLQ